MTTFELIENYLKTTVEAKEKVELQQYSLDGSKITVKYQYEREDITDLDTKYNTTHRQREEDIDLLDYITFVAMSSCKK